jgi:hypothetical protein
VPKRSKPIKRRALYKSPPPAPANGLVPDDLHATPIITAPFQLREDGSIQLATEPQSRREKTKTELTGLTELQNPAENNSENYVMPHLRRWRLP